MEVFEAVRTVLAVRQYQEKSVPPEVVRRIVEAGRLTGSARNSQPWHFIVVQDKETILQLAALAPSGPYLAQAPLAIVVLVEQTRFAVSDASRAIQSMMLAGWAEGVGSNWVGFMSFEGVKALLHIPAEKDVLAILPFGYPVKRDRQRQEKPPGFGRGRQPRGIRRAVRLIIDQEGRAMGVSFTATIIIALILMWVFKLNMWVSVIIAVIAGPLVAAGFQSLFRRKAPPPAPAAAPIDAVDVQFSEVPEAQTEQPVEVPGEVEAAAIDAEFVEPGGEEAAEEEEKK